MTKQIYDMTRKISKQMENISKQTIQFFVRQFLRYENTTNNNYNQLTHAAHL